jgi:acyl-coenzyme A synthetase/AMP-(fatty) acid ligase
VVVLAEMRNNGASRHDDLKRMINDLAVGLIGAPAGRHRARAAGTVPKTSSGKIRRVASARIL